MSDETQTGNIQTLEGVPPPLPQGFSKSNFPSPMGGITVGTLNDAPTGPRSGTIRHSVRGQAMAGASFVVSTLPAILLCLVLGLTHRAHLIPASSVWAWAAAAVPLVAVMQGAIRAAMRPAVGLAWLQPVLIALLILAPSGTVLYLSQAVHSVTTPLIVAQIGLYAIAVLALMMSSLSSAAEA